MERKTYRWRYPLDASRLDVSISMRGDNGVGVRPLPVRLLLCIIASLLGGAWILAMSPIKDMGPGWVVAFVLIWVYGSVVLLKPDKLGHPAIQQLGVLVNYVPRSSRYVTTRSGGPSWGALFCTDVDFVDEDKGIIHFRDGGVGYLYRVVGTASVLLFDSDRDAIINRVDAFWRNMKTDYEMKFITLRESQKVDRQLAAMDARIRALERIPEMREVLELARSEREVLEKRVGGEFKSIHQYLLIRSDSLEGLEEGYNMLSMEVENSTLMFKRVTALYDEDLTQVLQSIFRELPRRRRKAVA